MYQFSLVNFQISELECQQVLLLGRIFMLYPNNTLGSKLAKYNHKYMMFFIVIVQYLTVSVNTYSVNFTQTIFTSKKICYKFCSNGILF